MTLSRTVFSVEHMRKSKAAFSAVAGIYCLFRGDELLYIGKSINVMRRLAGHIASSTFFDFDSVFIHECETKDLNSLESKYINAHMPPKNVHIPGRHDGAHGNRRWQKKYGFLLNGSTQA